MSLAILTVLGVSAASAQADPVGYGAYVHGLINNENCRAFSDGAGTPWGDDNNCMFSGTDPRFFAPHVYGPVPYQPHQSATATLADADESIGASANLATGDLFVQLSSLPSSTYVSVAAVMWETLTFHFSDTAQHLVTVTMAGAVAASGGACGDIACDHPNAVYILALFQPPDPVLYPYALTMSQGVMYLPQGPYSVSSSMLVSDGMTVAVLAGLAMTGSGPAAGIAFDPLAFGLDGGTFTSESGVFLTQGVPEPATLALIGLGLAAAAVRQRKQRQRCRTGSGSL
jgi:hypothetical protein